jgi:S1-C subfamily serine protease
MRRVVRGIIIGLLTLAVIANGALAAAIFVTREPDPKPLTAERVANASKPAIVFIQSEYTITTSIPAFRISDETWNQLFESFKPQIYSGQITNSTQLEHAAEQAIMNNPDAYFSVGNTVSDTWEQWTTGSGFFVTEDGYLVTAAHVVSASKAEIRDGIQTWTKDPAFIADDRNQIKKDWADWSPTDAQVDNLVDFDARWIQRYISVDKIDSRYYLATGASVEAGDRMKSTGIRASVVSIDPTGAGHDIAILKANVTGVPALSIASQNPNLSDATYAMGYPRVPYLQEDVPANQSVPIAVTTGKVQRMNSRTTSDGSSWSVYGTDAQFTHGDSGGPVVDAKGNVIGVISFTIPDAQGNQLPGQGYFVPASFIRADLAKANVTLESDPKKQNLTNTYYHALAEGDIQRYKVELNLLLSIQSRSSWDAYVKDDVSHAQSEVLSGNDKTPPDLDAYVLPTTGAAAGIIVLALATWLVLGIIGRRRSRPAAVVEATSEPAPEAAAASEPPPITPVVTNGEPATEIVASPREVLRESEPIAQSTPPSAPTD